MSRLRKIRDEARQLADQMRSLHERAEREVRAFTDDENRQWGELQKRFEEIEAEIRRSEFLDGLEQVNRRSGLPGSPSPSGGEGAQSRDAVWVNGNGQEVRTLSARESIRSAFQDAHDEREWQGLTLGGLCRALIAGPRSDVERRALAEGTGSAGGFTVPTPLALNIIDRLRARAVIMRAGATTVPMDSGTLKIAKLLTDPVASWHAENTDITPSDPTFGQVELTARTLVSLVVASRELVEDSANLDGALQTAFARSLALELDRVCLVGSGTAPEPRGLMTISGVNEVSMGANGAAIADYSKMADLRLALDAANAELPTAWIMAPRSLRTIGLLKDLNDAWLHPPLYLKMNADFGGGFFDGNPGSTTVNPPWLSTTAVPVNQTQGSANNASTIFTGNFREMLVGMRAELRIEFLREMYAGKYQYGFLAHMRADMQLAHAQSFGRLVGIIP